LEICFDFIESARPWLGVSTIDLSETRAEECEADASVGHASDLFKRIHPLCRQPVLSRATQVRKAMSKRKQMEARSPGLAMLKRGAAEARCRLRLCITAKSPIRLPNRVKKATGSRIRVISVPAPVADNGFAALLPLAVLCL
jgi:hypothetical protein